MVAGGKRFCVQTKGRLRSAELYVVGARAWSGANLAAIQSLSVGSNKLLCASHYGVNSWVASD